MQDEALTARKASPDVAQIARNAAKAEQALTARQVCETRRASLDVAQILRNAAEAKQALTARKSAKHGVHRRMLRKSPTTRQVRDKSSRSASPRNVASVAGGCTHSTQWGGSGTRPSQRGKRHQMSHEFHATQSAHMVGGRILLRFENVSARRILPAEAGQSPRGASSAA